MAAVSVGTTAVKLSVAGRQRPMIQNLGPGTVYVGEDSQVTAATGLQLPVNAVMEYATQISDDGEVWVISTQAATDVRFLALGG